MTISKKLLLLATVGFGIQFGASAHFDATQLKNEVTTILNFIPTLRMHVDNNADQTVRNNSAKIVNWLETNLENKDWNTSLDNFHIIALANVIQTAVQNDAHINDTIEELDNIIANKNAEEARQKQEDLVRQRKMMKETILTIGGMGAFILAMSYMMKPIHLFSGSNPFAVQLV